MQEHVPWVSLCTTDDVSAEVEALQFTLGEGPCIDAHAQARPVLEPDLVDPAIQRWPAFGPAAFEAGVRAIFGFPLQLGSLRLGALNLYRDRPGPLSLAEHTDTLIMAGITANVVVVAQSQAPPGVMAPELVAGADFHVVVHQASGMVAVQLGVGIGEALVRLRAHAFGNQRELRDVAREVVDRRLRFRGDGVGDDVGGPES